MPCNLERGRKDDKLIGWKDAYADWENARNLALAADAAMLGSCGFMILTAGGFGFTAAACGASAAALSAAIANVDLALTKSNNAGDAYKLATKRYNDCLAGLHP